MIGFLMRLFHVRRRKQHNFGESIEASFVICVTLKKPEIDKKKKLIVIIIIIIRSLIAFFFMNPRRRNPICHDLRT